MESSEWIPVVIEWEDAHALSNAWTEPADLDSEPRIIRSIGWLIPDAKPRHHVIVQSIDQSHIDGALAIPDAMVQQVILLTDA
jgi:hypothetical protein